MNSRRIDLSTLSNHELVADLKSMVERERAVTLAVLRRLIEVERRKIHLEAYSSLYKYCTDCLGYSRSAACRRIQAARCLQRFPAVEQMLFDGRLNLTTVGSIARIISPENAEVLLGRVTGQPQEEVERVAAAYGAPVRVRDRIRPVRVARVTRTDAEEAKSAATATPCPTGQTGDSVDSLRPGSPNGDPVSNGARVSNVASVVAADGEGATASRQSPLNGVQGGPSSCGPESCANGPASPESGGPRLCASEVDSSEAGSSGVSSSGVGASKVGAAFEVGSSNVCASGVCASGAPSSAPSAPEPPETPAPSSSPANDDRRPSHRASESDTASPSGEDVSFRVEFTAAASFVAKFQRARSLASRSRPGVGLADVFEAALDEYLRKNDPTEREARREARRASKSGDGSAPASAAGRALATEEVTPQSDTVISDVDRVGEDLVSPQRELDTTNFDRRRRQEAPTGKPARGASATDGTYPRGAEGTDDVSRRDARATDVVGQRGGEATEDSSSRGAIATGDAGQHGAKATDDAAPQRAADDNREKAHSHAKKRPHIPAAVRDWVWIRDGGQCSHVGSEGRCPATTGLHVDHKHPHGQGGGTLFDNLGLLCAEHNQFHADLSYGKQFMSEKRRAPAAGVISPTRGIAGRTTAPPS